MGATSIEWSDWSINPFRARLGNGDGHYCEKLSPGCKHCYSSRLQPRFRMPQFQEQRGAGVEHYLDPRKLQQVLDRKKPTKFFWCDMTDMFGAWVPNEWIAACFGVMAATPQHTHQVLTKRAERLPEVFASVFGLESFEATVAREAERHGVTWDARGSTAHLYSWVPADLASRRAWCWPLPNVHLGVSAEDQQRANERIPHLLKCPAAVRWVSAEPLLGELDLSRYLHPTAASDDPEGDAIARTVFPRTMATLDRLAEDFSVALDWVVVGGESGQRARACNVAWIRSIVQQCKAARRPVFVKQLGRHVIENRGLLNETIGGRGASRNVFAARVTEDGTVEREWHPIDSKGGDPAEWPEDLRVRQMPEAA